jgi:hypothetical protein
MVISFNLHFIAVAFKLFPGSWSIIYCVAKVRIDQDGLEQADCLPTDPIVLVGSVALKSPASYLSIFH